MCLDIVRRDYEDELNFAFLMANKDKMRLDRFSCLIFD